MLISSVLQNAAILGPVFQEMLGKLSCFKGWTGLKFNMLKSLDGLRWVLNKLTFSSSRYKDIVKVAYDSDSIVVRVLEDRQRDTRLGSGEEGSEPVTVNSDTVPQYIHLSQWKAETIAKSLAEEKRGMKREI